ncbi:unannotated protein [freshwater metagenome]|uniref:Unannotated protein n=1 Tax=freshwater metagenome TaxID=449393 RepID=A0A6J6ZVV1_9ZZZZ
MSETPQSPPEPTWPAAAPSQGEQVSTSGNAIAALVLAIASWVVCPIVFAIIALVFSSLGQKEIAASGGTRHGGELVTAARIVAWINIGLWAALIIIALVIGFVVLVAGGLASITPGSGVAP